LSSSEYYLSYAAEVVLLNNVRLSLDPNICLKELKGAENISQDIRSRTSQKRFFSVIEHKFNHVLFVLELITKYNFVILSSLFGFMHSAQVRQVETEKKLFLGVFLHISLLKTIISEAESTDALQAWF
jgi:hypothetical protein